ncbi:MAG: hypothetical protein J6M93_05850 [Succinivibrio sp.]|nr:hypothetical protein [Succinivibrio sp.]
MNSKNLVAHKLKHSAAKRREPQESFSKAGRLLRIKPLSTAIAMIVTSGFTLPAAYAWQTYDEALLNCAEKPQDSAMGMKGT